MARIVCEVEPGIVFVENSAALLVRGLDTVLSDLAEMGFDARWGVLGAADAIWLDGIPTCDHERLRCFIKASNADRVRKLQPERCVANKWGRIGNCAQEIFDSDSIRQQSKVSSKTVPLQFQRNDETFERGRNRITNQTTATNNGWWSNEPGVGRMVHGMANRNDRIGAIGDGQVPAVVKLAWETLTL